ncbi:hypothetical protein CAPTEDRAFT_171427 [Capitella teleta]|uniref:Glycerate kinase n=2 Tax=Capitella teleta TaxID=283909 RepID=R7UEG0_CAPTE|nr:hypothetical protein CAPTEDRAFT_171427 [Capitella teleta]|eukprot:ELU02178.1 hypothetical protein CAPTEDRAFT_171427 [Capitella teleta]
MPNRGFRSNSQTIATQIDNAVLQDHAIDIFSTAINAVLPQSMVTKTLKLNGDQLIIGDETYDLHGNVYIVAFGKAVLGMVRAAEDVLEDHIAEGIASVPVGSQEDMRRVGKWDLLPRNNSRIQIIEGAANNIPDEMAHKAAMKIYSLLDSLTEKDLVLALFSGGGSALLPAPYPPVTLEEMAQVTRILSHKGATIQQLNTVRKHLEILKGGGLAKVAAPAKVIGLVMSDVVGNDPQFIASGPTSPNNTTAQQCLDLIKSLGVMSVIPESVISMLVKRAEASRHLKERAEYQYKNATTLIIGSNEIALEVAQRRARALGYLPYILSSSLVGNAITTGEMFAKVAAFLCCSKAHQSHKNSQQLMQLELDLIQSGLSKTTVNEMRMLATESINTNVPVCILGAGETTVEVQGSGKGGRNQEMALACGLKLHEFNQTTDSFEHNILQFLSGGTDGQDGPTDVAGACADPFLINWAEKEGIDAQEHLDNNDSYHFYHYLRNGRYHIRTGLTGTNVMDIHCMLIQHHEFHTSEFS